MADRCDMDLSAPLAFRKNGETKTLRTLDDARGLLSTQEPGESESELC